VLLTLSSQYGANTLDATRAVEQAVDELKPALAAGVRLYPALHRPANFIETAPGIARDLVMGAGMIALVLFAFMRRWKVVLIAFLSIPLAGGRAAGAQRVGHDDQRDDAGRVGRGAGRGDRRCHRRYREHRAPPA
jgi:hypothetical protein